MKPLHTLAVLRLDNNKTRDKLIPILNSARVNRMTVVRYRSTEIGHDKLVEVVYPRQTHLNGWINRLRTLWFCFWQGLTVARQERVDLVLAVNFFPYGLIAWSIARLSGKKVAVSLIGTDFNRRVKSPLLGPLLRPVLRRCDALTIFGDDAKQALVALGVPAARVFVIPNAMKTDLYKPNDSAARQYDLIYTGYLRQPKRVDRVLEVLQAVRQQRPQTRLLVVGDGEERENLKTLANKLGLEEAVTFAGWSDQVLPLLQQSRVFISLSEHEGLPVAMLEAMCTGLPVVVTDVGAIHTVVENGLNGYRVTLNTDIDTIAGDVLKLLDDANHYAALSQAAQQVRDNFSYENATRAWDTIFAALFPS